MRFCRISVTIKTILRAVQGKLHSEIYSPVGRGDKMTSDVLSLIQKNMSSFSKRQRAIAAFIMDNYDKAAFMTASRLGKTVNVSESTVVRFAAELGYEGYPEMQQALQEMIRNKLTSIQRIEVSNDRIGSSDILSAVMQSDMEKLRLSMDTVDRGSFNTAVNTIVHAKHIYILGLRSSTAIAGFLGFYLNLLFENVVLVHTTSVSEMFEQVLRIGPGDVMIGISFPRYSSRTVKVMQFASDRGAEVLAITDSEASPLYGIAHTALLAKSDMVSFIDSLVAPLSLVNALIVAIGRQMNADLSDTFAELEKIWAEYGVYENAGHIQ